MSATVSPSGGGGSTSGGGGPCGACKFLRRKCVPGCIFAPYFDSDQGAAHFAAVHKVFGASNVSKLLLHIPLYKRHDAVATICYEAQTRLRDPVYGCVAHIFALQQQVVNLQAELTYLQAHLATLELALPQPPPPSTLPTPPPLSTADLLLVPSVPARYDLSSLLDPTVQPSWDVQQRQMDLLQYGGSSSASATTGSYLEALSREVLHRHGSPPIGSIPCNDSLSSPSMMTK
ncbi:hypothetical protein K2173_024855 [Erythroxylum novogranatense]|uniref:LOB domain-containing protein n=1 Tax=Erythroxylum novogranatense TaxID=1862640 RepID=A0AAV8UCP3_9ROSI|nr:hypothetical protein K2173_024855 [Erythroxylum novogranatense]